MAKNNLKLIATIGLVAMLLIVPSIPSVVSIDDSKQQKFSAFLQNVIGLDTQNYETKMVSDTATISGTNVLYNLNSEDSKLEIICNFRNNELISCSINQIKGSVTIANPERDTLSAVQTLLGKYQTYANATYIQSLKTNVDGLTELRNTTITNQFAKFSVTIRDGDYQCFEWMNSPNGIHNMYNKVSVIFQNGSLKSFTDAWNQYTVGNYAEILSKEQAIVIAKTNLETYSYEFGNETIANLQANEKVECVIANLTMQPRNNMLYPHWEIILPLDRVYPGFTYGFRVMLWADTGEVSSARATGSLGYPVDENSSNTIAPISGTTNKLTSTSAIYIIAGLSAIIIAIAAMVLAKKTRPKKIARLQLAIPLF